MDSYTYKHGDRQWDAARPHDTAPMPAIRGDARPASRGQLPSSPEASPYPPGPPSAGGYYDAQGFAPSNPQAPFDDYEEYFWGEGTEVKPRRMHGCSVFLGILVAVALAAMLWPQAPLNYDALRGTSLDQLQDWARDTFGIAAPEPSAEELEAIYQQDARASTGFLRADAPTALDSVPAAQHYYRSALDDHAQEVYDALEAGLINMDADIEMPAYTSSEELQAVWQFVLYDHPEVFNLANDAHVTYWTRKGQVTRLSPLYKYPQDTATAMAAEYADLALELPLLAGTQSETMENICAYVADTADYGSTGNDQYIDSVFTERRSVCAGYSKAVQYLALRHGIPCVYITGTATDYLGTGGNHAWLAAFVDGSVRYYDPTWFDQRGWHATQFLDMNLVEISADHAADYPQLLPR